MDTACGVTMLLPLRFRGVPLPEYLNGAYINSWGSWSRKGFRASPVQLSHFTRRREGRKLRSTAENPPSGVGPTDRITRDEVMLKLRKQGELRDQGNRAQSAKKSFLRDNKAIRATVPTRGIQEIGA